MKTLVSLLLTLTLILPGCSSEPEPPAEVASTPPQPANIRSAASPDDIILMAEFIVLTDLIRTRLEQRMKDSAAMGQIAAQVDFTQPNASAALTKVSVKYLHGVLTDAQLPIEQFAATAKTPDIKLAAESMAKQIQRISNQYFRALAILEDPATVGPSEMQQVGMLISGTNFSMREIEKIGADVVQSARRALGH